MKPSADKKCIGYLQSNIRVYSAYTNIVCLRTFFSKPATFMSLIPRQPQKARKETVSVRMSPEIIALLDDYCEYLNSGRQHVIEESLRYTFAQDTEFQRWRDEERSPRSIRSGWSSGLDLEQAAASGSKSEA